MFKFFVVVFASCLSNSQCWVPTQSNFQLELYLGKWYEIYQTRNIPETSLTATDTTYLFTRNRNNTITLTRQQWEPLQRRWDVRQAVMWVNDPSQQARFVVQVADNPFLMEHRVVMTDYINFAVVYGAVNAAGRHLKYAWIISRRPSLEGSFVERAFRAVQGEISSSNFVRTRHNNSPGGSVIVDVITVRQCGSLPSVPNGYVEWGGSQIGDRRSVTCNDGYDQHGDIEIICQSNGHWSRPGSCQRQPLPQCRVVPTVQFGRVSRGGFNVGDRREITCDPGYVLHGNREIECYDHGFWSAPGYCERRSQVYCERLPIVPNAEVLDGCWGIGCRREIRCYYGFARIEPCRLYCMDDGEWHVQGGCIRYF